MARINRALSVCVLLSAVMAMGCQNGFFPSLARPNWRQPGPTDYQRYNAMVHDPYPDTNAGPEALGTRPRDYSTSINDSQRYPMKHGAGAQAGSW